MSKLVIPVMEMFGPTIQGEGRVIGRKTMFLRTGGCDYKCDWCDSKFTWDGSEKSILMTPHEIIDQLIKLAGDSSVGLLNFNHVTISGGNPALIGDAMGVLISLLQNMGIEVGLETQGSRWQTWMALVDDLCISPKPPSSKMITNWVVLDAIVHQLNASFAKQKPYLKVVVFNDEDFAYAKTVHQRYPDNDFFISVGNLEPYTAADRTRALLDDLDGLFNRILQDPEMNNVRPLPQLHTLVWGNKRGV